MTEQHYPIHTVLRVSDGGILLQINFDDVSYLRGGTEPASKHLVAPRDMYTYGYKCVEKHGDIWTWVYKPVASGPPAKRGRPPKKTE